MEAPDCIFRYRCLILLVRTFNDIYAVTMMASKTMLTGVAVVTLYFSIRYKGLIGGMMGIMGADLAIIVSLAFSCLAEFQSRSRKVLRAMEVRSAVGWKRTKASVAALQPIAFRMGRFYSVDKTTVLTLLELITTALANMLLLLSK